MYGVQVCYCFRNANELLSPNPDAAQTGFLCKIYQFRDYRPFEFKCKSESSMLPSSKVLPTIYMCFVKPKIKITFVTEINTVFQYDLFTVLFSG